MNARSRTRADSELSVYLGNLSIGEILVRAGKITALDASGAKLGVYRSDKEAMAAVIAAARRAA